MRITKPGWILGILPLFALSGPTYGLDGIPLESIDSLSQDLSEQVIAWRRDFVADLVWPNKTVMV